MLNRIRLQEEEEEEKRNKFKLNNKRVISKGLKKNKNLFFVSSFSFSSSSL